MRRHRGATLLETLLSLFLLLLVLLLVFNLYPAAMSSTRLSGQRLQADALADSLLEEQCAVPFGQLVVGPPRSLDPVPGRGTVFHPTLEVFQVNEPGTDPDRIRGLRVMVEWNEDGVRRRLLRQTWRTDVRR